MIESYRERLPLIDGAVEAVERTAERYDSLGLATSANRPLIDLALRESGLDRLFRRRCRPRSRARQAAPDVYLEAARRLGVDPAETMAVEDSYNGS